MADYNKEDSGRRDYGRVGEKTREGRVLRQRRPRIGSTQPRGERVDYQQGHLYGRDGQQDDRSRSEGYRSSGRSGGFRNNERRSPEAGGYRERRPYREDGGERRSAEAGSYRERRPYREDSSEGHRPYRDSGQHRDTREGGYRTRRSSGSQEGFRRRPEGGRGPAPKARKQPRRINPYAFSKKDEENINRILDGKPQLATMDEAQYVDNAPLAKDEMRLNKFIANSGICSRREADTMIQAGVVSVNGQVVTELGTKVNIFNDEVRFNGERIKGEEKVYIVMNKPKGYVTTTSDPHADKTVMDLLDGCTARVFPVGRLDKATTGVLMFTNDGEIAERLTHPSYDKKKIYQVILDHNLSEEDYDAILSGITLADGDIAADELSFIDDNDRRKLGIEIHSGKNRIVRRIFESLGYDVRALDRVYFAGVTKKGLKRGEWRYLSEKEASMLKMGAYV